MRKGLRANRALATLAVVGAALLTTGGALTVPATPLGTSSTPQLRETAGLSVQIGGDVIATANAQAPYGVLVEAVSTLKDLTNVAVQLAVTDAPFADADALREFTDSPADTAVHQVGAAPFGTVGTPPGGTPPVGAPLGGALVEGERTTASLVVPAGGFGLPSDSSGVYGIVITVTVGGEATWTRAAPLTWGPSGLPKLNVTAVATITGAESRVSALLTAAADPRVTLLVDPTALTFSQLVALIDRDAYVLPASNIDVTAAAHTETPALIEAAISRTRAVSSLPWLAVAAAADDATLRAATKAGAVAVLADSRWATLAAPTGGGVYDAGLIEAAATAPVVVADPDLSTMLATRSPADPTTSAWLVAQAAFEAMSGAGSVIMAPGESWGVDGGTASRAIAVMFAAPFVMPVTLTDVLSNPDRVAVDLPDVEPLPSDTSADEVVGAVSGLTRLDGLAAATTGRSTMIMDAERGLLESLSLQNRANPAFRSEQSSAAIATATDVLSSVAVTSGSQLLLVSSSGSIPITVSNGLDVPVTIRVAVTSRSPILRTRDTPVATIEAGADATVKVPVTAISSGDVSVAVALRTEEGATVAVAETLNVRVRAAWGNLATGIFTLGLVVLLIAGVVRTVRRGRKDTRLGPSAIATVAGAADADA